MMTNEQLKARHEKAVGDRFIEEFYNQDKYCNFAFKKQHESQKPDLIYYNERTKGTIGIEVTDAYYDDNDAKGAWDVARDKTDCTQSGTLVNPDKKLADFINDGIEKKGKKSYEFQYPIILLVVTRPALTGNKQDFEENILPYIRLPNRIQFSDIYLDLSFRSCHQYYHLYPK